MGTERGLNPSLDGAGGPTQGPGGTLCKPSRTYVRGGGCGPPGLPPPGTKERCRAVEELDEKGLLPSRNPSV